MQVHDENGGSQLDKRAGCPGSRNAEEGIPNIDTDASLRGTELHAVMEKLVRTGDLGIALAQVSADDMGAVEFCLSRVQLAQQDHKGSLITEYHVNLDHLGIALGGTVDIGIINAGGPAWVADYKFGRTATKYPKNSRQAQAYASGIMKAFGCTSVTFEFIQPAMGEDQQPSVTWTQDEMVAIDASLSAIVASTLHPDAPLAPGSHCAFCRAKSTCRARAEVAGTVAVLRDPVAVMAATAPEDRAALWERLDLAIDMLKTAQDKIEEEAIAGTLLIPGYERKETLRDREWTDPEIARIAMIRVAEAKGLTAESIEPRKLLSPGAADKILGKGKAVQAALFGLTKRDPGNPKLARVSL